MFLALSERSQVAEDEDNKSLVLDLQLGVIIASALLLLVPDDALRNLLLGVTLIVAVTVGLRRWLVAHQRLTLSVGVLLACLVGAMLHSVHLDGNGQAEWAIVLLFGTVATALITWW